MDEWMYFILGAAVGVVAATIAAQHGFGVLNKQNRLLRKMVDTERAWLVENLNTVLEGMDANQDMREAIVRWRDSVGEWVGQDVIEVLKGHGYSMDAIWEWQIR
jgi:hypothetical protein